MREYMRFLSYLIMLTNLITAITITIFGGFTNLKDREKPNIQKEPYKTKITLTNDYVNKDINILMVAKNIENDGLGTWYTSTPITPYSSASVEPTTYQYANADIIIQNQDQNIETRLGFVISIMQQPYKRWVSYCYLENNGVNKTIYTCSENTGGFYKNNATFIIRKITQISQDAYTLINQFFNVYTFGDSQFTFNTDWNYNAPYNIRASEPLINDANFIGTGGIQYKRINLPYFISNGLVFNQIEILYMNANGSRIKQDNQYIVVTSSGFGYYFYMNYKNTNSNLEKYVNGRLYGTYADSNGDVQTYIDKGSQWTNYKYKTITFVEELSGQQQDQLARFNNLGGYGYNTTTSGNVFDLIAEGFRTWTHIFSMQVGTISLSMLVLAPLLIGFIVWLIKLVKRGG